MGSSSPPFLPITNPQPSAPSSGVGSIESQPPIATPAFQAFINNVSHAVREGLAQRRPWSEILDLSAFSRPDSPSDALLRIRKNYAYYRVNYFSLLALVLAVSLISDPLSLFLLASLLASWIFAYLLRPSDRPLVLFGRTFNNRETLGLLIVITAFVFFLTSVGVVLISAVTGGLFIVLAHAAFRVPEDLFLDEQDSAATGFLSFLGGAASNATAAPIVASRV